MSLPLLSLIIFLPVSGIFFISLIKEEDTRNAKAVALWISSLTFLMSLVLLFQFDSYNSEYQFVEKHIWIEAYNIHYHLGIDGISLFFILLSTFLTPFCILVSWNSIQKRVREYMMAFLLLETLMIGVFCALDVLLFYIFFEGVLIPLFLIIGIWGGERRTYACFKFFLYTLLGSVFMLIAIIKLYNEAGTTDITAMTHLSLNPYLQKWLWISFFAGMAVKIPMWPFHTWLPDAHVEAPTAGSVLLAAVLLKMGGYGFLRFSIPLLPEASQFFAPYVFTLSVIAIIYTSLVALVQTDIKKLIAYSSVAHMGFVTLGLFTLNLVGMTGAVVQMISHGLISGALFLCVGMLYERFHTRDIASYGGLVKIMPVFSAFFMFFIFASIALPGTSGFVGEFFVLLGVFQSNLGFAFLTVLGMILGAAYSLWLYRRICFGKLIPSLAEMKGIQDLHHGERLILSSLVILILFLGIYPKHVTNIINRSMRHVIEVYETKNGTNQNF
ncbi:MAG: NADH-quinone oxidoreductase subunit M [Alphaproteobacteria bacterium]|nr:NADH-quinone oxidoreductase subunit M [Alphaproteobacteria bacterium]